MISMISEALQRLLASFDGQEGQGLAEYGLILTLIALVAIAALTTMGLAISGQLEAIAGSL